MIDEREPGGVEEQAVGKRQFDSQCGDPSALIGTGLLGAFLGGFVVWVLHSFRFTEPPIRVKGGSMYLDLGAGPAVWEKLGNSGKKWRVKGAEKVKVDYMVSIVTSSNACPEKERKGTTVTVWYTEQNKERTLHSVKLRAQNKKTMVDASHELKCANSGKRLMFEAPGHISKLAVDDEECTFSSAADLDHALLTEF